MSKNEKIAIGIDLGTTYSCVGVFDQGKAEIIANELGNRTTPSCVAFSDTELMVGEAAMSQFAMNPSNTIVDVKRLIGRRFEDPNLQANLKHWPFKVIEDAFGKAKFSVEFKGAFKEFTPEEITSMILGRMKRIAESHFSRSIMDAVVTVPAYFNDSQRQATKDAGFIAGLNVIRIINEPTAAAIAYGLDKRGDKQLFVLIFDLGGGTLDVSILSINNGVFEVKATAGDTHLGGEDFDNRLMEHFLREFKSNFDKDLYDNQRAIRRLRSACEKAKRTLSTADQAEIELCSLHEEIDFITSITKTQFEELCRDLFERTIKSVEKAISDANMDKSLIDEIVLVGGSSRIPKIQSLLSQYFDGKALDCSIDPDEAIAMGAAIQAAILKGDTHDAIANMLLFDVAPLSLGIETVGGVMTTLIERNTKIPVAHTRIFSTYIDYQAAVTIKVYEGERAMTKDNHMLGKFNIIGIAQAPRGIPKIEVTFDIDANGILNVSATDKSSGKREKITITNDKGHLSIDEINKMVVDAQLYKSSDDNFKERIFAKNSLESFCFNVKAIVSDDSTKERISKEECDAILNKCDGAIAWLETHPNAEAEEMRQKQREVEAVCSPILSSRDLVPHKYARTQSDPGYGFAAKTE